jgi:hypothetical protein
MHSTLSARSRLTARDFEVLSPPGIVFTREDQLNGFRPAWTWLAKRLKSLANPTEAWVAMFVMTTGGPIDPVEDRRNFHDLAAGFEIIPIQDLHGIACVQHGQIFSPGA